jgi:hypothetical protein
MSSKENSFENIGEKGIVGWWLKQLKETAGEDFNKIWSSYPDHTKKVIANQLKMATIDISKAHLSNADIDELVDLGGVPLFFDALLESVGWPESFKTQQNFKRNMANHIAGSIRPYFNKMVFAEPIKERKIKRPLTDETLEKYNPFTMKKRICTVCGKRRLNRNNKSDRCSQCQHDGKIKNGHKHRNS